MIYVDADFPSERNHKVILDRNEYEDDNLIKITDKNIIRTEDYGDEDVTKMVSEVQSCTIHIDASIADDFKDVTHINFLRWYYYMPAYNIRGMTIEKTMNDDGSITFKVA